MLDPPVIGDPDYDRFQRRETTRRRCAESDDKNEGELD
jgi:hypothetical protein